MLWILASAHSAIVLFLTARIFIRQDITSPARLAWFIAFTFLPGIGSAIYLLFGEVYLSRSLIKRHTQATHAIQDLGPQILGNPQLSIDEISPIYQGAFRYATSINNFAPTTGNRFELLENSNAFCTRLVQDIDNANVSVCILYYIWLSDNTGTRIADAIIRAANRGVTCRILVDQIGSSALLRDKLWGDMQAAGAQCLVAMQMNRLFKFRAFNRFDLRNHRKITVVDGHIAYCGSRNCADPEFRVKPKYAPWVDIISRVEGPCVNQMLALFATDWLTTAPTKTIDDFSFYARPVDNGCIAQVRGTGPLERRFSALQSFVAAIHSARHSLTITTPYFVPDSTLLNALCKAALGGVSVTLNLPARNDSRVVSAASRSNYLLLLRSGVGIFEYTPGLLHSKIMTIDDIFSIIGSSNLDLRSFDLNYENDMLIYDQATTAAIHTRQKAYLADSRAVSLSEVEKWSVPRQVWYNLVGTLGPIL